MDQEESTMTMTDCAVATVEPGFRNIPEAPAARLLTRFTESTTMRCLA
jgi:hypothetical protein